MTMSSPGKQTRALDLGKARYELRRAAGGPSYALEPETGTKYQFGDPMLQADLRSTWREKYDDDPPSDLSAVIFDLNYVADKAEPDPPSPDEQAAGIIDGLAEAGGDGPADLNSGALDEIKTALGLPDEYRVPPDYEMAWDGVWKIVKWKGETGAEEPVYKRITWAPLLPIRIYSDPDGDQMTELAWADRGRYVTRRVPRSIAKSGRKLVATTGDAGLPVVEADSKECERWIAAAEAINWASIEHVSLARWLGWQPDGTFVSTQGMPYRIEPAYPEQVAALAAHAPHGTLAGWQDAVRLLAPYPAAQMGLYAGLAAPLLEPLGLDSFTIDFSGRSTRGKTTSGMVSLSPWANPSEKGNGLFSWRTTMIALEKRLSLVRGLPVFVDESRLVSSPEFVDKVIYQVPKNEGHARGGGWPKQLPWLVVMVSTGEQPVTSFTTFQGASSRVLSVSRPPFGTNGESSARAAIAVRDGIAGHYGIAGPAFVERLREQLAERDGCAQLVARHSALAAGLQGSTDISARRAPLAACLALAAELSIGWDIVPLPVPGMDTWRELLAADDPSDDRAERALDVVREFVAANPDQLWQPRGVRAQPLGGWIGRLIRVEGEQSIALLPERLREALRHSGYDLDAVVPGWLEAGQLVEVKGTRPTWQPSRLLLGKNTRMVVFMPGVIRMTEPQADDDE